MMQFLEMIITVLLTLTIVTLIGAGCRKIAQQSDLKMMNNKLCVVYESKYQSCE